MPGLDELESVLPLKDGPRLGEITELELPFDLGAGRTQGLDVEAQDAVGAYGQLGETSHGLPQDAEGLAGSEA